jgi:O-6-methylguanine DNA methyltransferase
MTPSVPGGHRAAPAPVMIATAALQTPIGTLRLYGGPRGLLTLALPNEARAATGVRLQRLLGPVALAEDAGALAAALAQVADYFGGDRRSFDLALDPRGTPFQHLVWEAVARVPYGETRTYGEIARAIGRANGANPLPLLIPCHRLIGASGALTGYGGSLATKRWLLALERGQPALV